MGWEEKKEQTAIVILSVAGMVPAGKWRGEQKPGVGKRATMRMGKEGEE